MNLMVQKQSQPDIMNIFEKIIDAAYGIKSLDGRTFTKDSRSSGQSSNLLRHTTSFFMVNFVWTKSKASEFLLNINAG